MSSFFSMLILWGIPLLMAVILHEIAHGYVALKCGDPTAKRARRLTLNPLKHIDPVGSILLPGFLLLVQAPFLFGYAKPVPVDFRKLHHFRRDTFLVAIAGPATNVCLAILGSLLLHALPLMPGDIIPFATQFLHNVILVNGVLAVFNMLPMPPLDGSRILSVMLPVSWARYYNRLERFSFFFLIGLFLFPIVTEMLLGTPVNILSGLILAPTRLLIEGIGFLTGHLI